MPDKVVNYIKARIIEENQRPEIQNWWRGPAKGSEEWRLSSQLWEASRLGNSTAVLETIGHGVDVNAANPECVGMLSPHCRIRRACAGLYREILAPSRVYQAMPRFDMVPGLGCLPRLAALALTHHRPRALDWTAISRSRSMTLSSSLACQRALIS